jgi:acyl carrier protein
MPGVAQQFVLDGLTAFVENGTTSTPRTICSTDLLRDDLAIDSLRLLMVMTHVAEQMDLELSDFADVDFHGIESVADLIDIFDSVSQAAAS